MPTELIVISHLRWDWVWQRPQQLMSRLAPYADTWFVEEPMAAPGRTGSPRLRSRSADGVRRVWLEAPAREGHIGFDDALASDYLRELPRLIGTPKGERIVWIYTPLALDVAESLQPTTLVYDVMDDLAAFLDAPRELVVRARQALRRADVVFAGGRSLHASVVRQGRSDAHLLPSGVALDHYRSEPRRPASGRPVAGYVGVIDERLDLELIASIAAQLPEWTIRMVGPVSKIDPATLPQGPNIEYLGQRAYEELPGIMGGFDVALMPFALNEATAAISPTKTLEYLAAGLPVVSTRVSDVVSDFGSIVDLRDDATGFADVCRAIRAGRTVPTAERDRIVASYDWDRIADRMRHLAFHAQYAQLDGDAPRATA